MTAPSRREVSTSNPLQECSTAITSSRKTVETTTARLGWYVWEKWTAYSSLSFGPHANPLDASLRRGHRLGKKGESTVSSIRKHNNERGAGRIDRARVRAATDAQIEQWKKEEGFGDYEVDNARAVPAVNVREIRERIGLTQEQFAVRYRLSLRTIQEWEQGRKQPSEAARVLLFAISRDPRALQRALH